MLRIAMMVGVLLLGGCVDYAKSEFTTTQDIDLRGGQDDESHIIAHLPRGTPVERLGNAGAECECWLVATPEGIGWVYTRFLQLHLADVAE